MSITQLSLLSPNKHVMREFQQRYLFKRMFLLQYVSLLICSDSIKGRKKAKKWVLVMFRLPATVCPGDEEGMPEWSHKQATPEDLLHVVAQSGMVLAGDALNSSRKNEHCFPAEGHSHQVHLRSVLQICLGNWAWTVRKAPLVSVGQKQMS